MDRRKKEQRADPPVEIRLLATVVFELGAGGEQFGRRAAGAPALNREIPRLRRGGLDNVGDTQGHENLSAVGGRRPVT